jgi:hypothetical protein
LVEKLHPNFKKGVRLHKRNFFYSEIKIKNLSKTPWSQIVSKQFIRRVSDFIQETSYNSDIFFQSNYLAKRLG